MVEAPKPPQRKPDLSGTKPRGREESKQEKFLRLANRRVPVALKALARVANLANTTNYEYTPAQRDKILTVLTEVMHRVSGAFLHERNGDSVFRL